MSWRFKLDNQVKKNPIGWEDAEMLLKFDREFRIYTSEFSVDVKFTADAYDYIVRIDELGICNKILVTIDRDCDGSGTFTSWFEGYIFVSDVIYDEVECTASAPIQDNSWTTRLKNNRPIKAYPNVARSKNDDTITAATNRNIDFFTPSTGLYGTIDVEAYLVFDVLTFLVAFMSDNEMTFSSTLFDAGGALEGLVLTTGNAIRDPGNTGYAPFVSFEDLFRNLHQLFNLAAYIDLSGAKPDLVIETTDTVRKVSAPVIYSFENLDNLKRSYKTELLYTKVKIGSETTQDDNSGAFAFADGQYFGHKEEEYHYAGECNISSELDLVKTYIIDSNVIEDIIVNAVTDYDKDVFIVETGFDFAANDNATAGDIFDPTGSPPVPSVYNPGLTNKESVRVYWAPNGMPTDLTLLLGDGNDGCDVELTADITSVAGIIQRIVTYPAPTGALELDNENSDPNNNWDNGANNYFYTIPSTGFYRFALDLEMDNFNYIPVSHTGYDIEFTIERWETTTNTKVEERTYTNNGFSGTSISESFEPAGFYCDVNDVIMVGVNITPDGPGPYANMDIDAATAIRTTVVQNSGGTYQAFDIDDYRVKQWQFKSQLSKADHDAILATPNEAISLNLGTASADEQEVFIEEMKYIPETGEVEITAINSNN